jgi:hypothetical protein
MGGTRQASHEVVEVANGGLDNGLSYGLEAWRVFWKASAEVKGDENVEKEVYGATPAVSGDNTFSNGEGCAG